MEYLLGIDFGGSSSKATLIDCNGNIICTASHEYPMYYPQDGFCEQAAEDCYEAFPLQLIPYYAFANRGTTEMHVWLLRK
jgi:sugar (pentulose or hexulose) kinase